jgi:hypothetical protein
VSLSLANVRQAESIRRYHARNVRLGRSSSLEESAREWVGRFARLWREHYTNRPRFD